MDTVAIGIPPPDTPEIAAIPAPDAAGLFDWASVRRVSAPF
jgi:hypothetical protein